MRSTLTFTKEHCCEDFQPFRSADVQMWTGTLVDLFSPDDVNPVSRRFIDFRNNELEISASTGTEKWGKKFFPHSNVNPVLTTSFSSARSTVSFLSKIPKNSPLRSYAELGALNFTLTMGTAFGRRMLRFNGLYDGHGGLWVPAGKKVPPSDCDNFWEYEQ